MSGHVCEGCMSDVFTIVYEDGVKVFECMSCGSRSKLKAKGIRLNKETKVNTGIPRPEFTLDYKTEDYQVYLKRWLYEWKRRTRTS